MIELVEPTLRELLMVCGTARQDDQEQFQVLYGRPWHFERQACELYNGPGIKFALVDGHEPIVAGGYINVINGVWQSWMIGSTDQWEKHWRSITRHSRKVMARMFKELRATRLQTLVLPSRTKTCEWYVRGLKMKLESVMDGFGASGEAVAMYAITKGDSHVLELK